MTWTDGSGSPSRGDSYRQMMRDAKRTRFRREHGMTIRNLSTGRPEAARERRRRNRIRWKAAALGITFEQAEAMTPRMPQMARRPRERDAEGRFVAGSGRPRTRPA